LYPFKVIDKMYDEGDNSLITVEYEFITPNNSYRVEFYSGEYSPESKTFDLSFGVNTGEFNTIDTFQMTGEGNARKILKTIRNIIEDFIDKNTIIGPYFSVHSENHSFSQNKELYRFQDVTRKGIKIGSNCWIGAKVTILDGVIIGNNSVIAAGAVVTRSFKDNVLLGGVPAKIIKVLE
ncbi:MAG: acyltransferase, partial [Vicingaceae bacterium]